jgi:hypothetical protein
MPGQLYCKISFSNSGGTGNYNQVFLRGIYPAKLRSLQGSLVIIQNGLSTTLFQNIFCRPGGF